MNNRRLEPREEDPYLVALRYFRANPILLVYLVIVVVLVFSAVQIGITADVAHQIGVSSYG